MGFLHYSVTKCKWTIGNCVEGHKLVGLCYVAPSPVKNCISVPSSPLRVFVLKAEWYPSSPVMKVLQWPLDPFSFLF